MGETFYSGNAYKWKYYIDGDYGYTFEDSTEKTMDDEISKAIITIKTTSTISLERLYTLLTKEEKRFIMDLILNDPNLL